MLQQLLCLAGGEVEQENIRLAMQDPDVSDDASLVRREERFAT